MVQRRRPSVSGLAPAYYGAIGFGLMNPITPILFAAATPSLINQGQAAIPAAIGGAFLGSLGWWALLSLTVCFPRQRVTGRRLNHINKCAALFVAYVAIGMLIAGFRAAGLNHDLLI